MKIYSNQKFGFLTAVKKEGISNNPRHETWVCRCVCGTMRVVRVAALLYGRVTSCGCMRKNKSASREMIPIKDKVLVRRINEFAKQSKTTPTTWVEEVLEDWIREHRSGKFIEDMDRHTARNEDTSWDQFTDVFSPGDIMEVVT